MKYTKQALIDEMKRSIKRNEEKIAEYSKPCDARKRRIRALERDLLKKKNKELEDKIKELEDAFEYVWEVAAGELREWFRKLENRNNFARAWLDGYEVEKEKRYYIRLKNVDENYNYLNYIKHLNAWCLAEIKTDKKFRTTHTRKELEEAGFGWVFDCEGIEIEEVE